MYVFNYTNVEVCKKMMYLEKDKTEGHKWDEDNYNCLSKIMFESIWFAMHFTLLNHVCILYYALQRVVICLWCINKDWS